MLPINLICNGGWIIWITTVNGGKDFGSALNRQLLENKHILFKSVSGKVGCFSSFISHRFQINVTHNISNSHIRVHSVFYGEIPNKEKDSGQTLSLGWIPRVMDLVLNPRNVRFQPHPVHQNHRDVHKRLRKQRHTQQRNQRTLVAILHVANASSWSQERNALHPTGSEKHLNGESNHTWGKGTAVDFPVPDPSPFMGSRNWKEFIQKFILHICAYTSPALFIQLYALWTSFTFSLMPTFPSHKLFSQNKWRNNKEMINVNAPSDLNCK